MIPPIGNLIIAMIKNSAVIGAVFALADDLLKEARHRSTRPRSSTNEVFFWAAVGYLLLTVRVDLLGPGLERRLWSGDEQRANGWRLPLQPGNWEWLFSGNNFRSCSTAS